MKKVFNSIFLIMIILLTGCTQNSLIVIEDNAVYELENSENIIIKNNQELLDLINNQNYKKLSSKFIDVLEKYDENFFKNEMLLVIFVVQNHGGTTFSLKNIEEISETIKIEIKYNVPNMVDEAITSYVLFVETSNNIEIKNIEVKKV